MSTTTEEWISNGVKSVESLNFSFYSTVMFYRDFWGKIWLLRSPNFLSQDLLCLRPRGWRSVPVLWPILCFHVWTGTTALQLSQVDAIAITEGNISKKRDGNNSKKKSTTTNSRLDWTYLPAINSGWCYCFHLIDADSPSWKPFTRLL